MTCLTASILLSCHRNPDEKSEIAAEKEQKQRCGKPLRDQWYCVSLPKGVHATTLSASCQSLSKTGPLANPIQWQRGGVPAVQQHLYAGYHHLLLPVCKPTCYQKVPLWSKDITSKYIFTSKERRKQMTQRLLVSAICFLNHSKLRV